MAEGLPREELSASEFMFDFYCELCNDDGKHLEAEGFCVDCEEYLCGSCYNAHPKTRQTRYHELLEKSTMPKDTPLSPDRISKDISTKCKHHAGKVVEFYCKTHAILGCNTCLVKDHRGCQDIELIIEKSESILDSQEYKDFIETLNSLNTRAQGMIAKAHTNISQTKTCYSDAIKSVEKFRGDVNMTLDQLEQDIAAHAKRLQSEEEQKLTALSNECSNITKSIESMLADQHSLKSSRRVCQVYISMKESAKHIKTLQGNLKRTDMALVMEKFSFKSNPKLQAFLSRPYALGEMLKQTKTNQPATQIADIDVSRYMYRDAYRQPSFVCVSNDGNTIYVSGCTNQVISLTFDGKVKSEYRGRDIDGAMIACVDHHDNVYVWGLRSRNVIMLTADLTNPRTILTRYDGLDSDVNSVSHCYVTNRLYVTSSDRLKVFQLS